MQNVSKNVFQKVQNRKEKQNRLQFLKKEPATRIIAEYVLLRHLMSFLPNENNVKLLCGIY